MKKPGASFRGQENRRVWKRLQQWFSLDAESEVVAEFQASRNQTISALRYVLLLLLIPLLVNQVTKVMLVEPLTQYVESGQQVEIHLEGFQEERILKELQTYKNRLRFESLLRDDSEGSTSITEEKLLIKAVDLAEEYRKGNTQVIEIFVADFLSLIVFLILVKGQTHTNLNGVGGR